MSARLLVSLCVGLAVTFGKLRDPLVAHAFQWAAYHKQIADYNVASPAENLQWQPEAFRVTYKDGYALLHAGETTVDYEYLVMVGLRNFVSATAANTEFQLDAGMHLAGRVIVNLVDALKTAAYGHFAAVMTGLAGVRTVKDRLFVKKGFVDLHMFIARVVNAGYFFENLKSFVHFSWAMRELSAVASLSLSSVSRLPQPMKGILTSLAKLVKNWESALLSRPQQARFKEGRADLSAVHKFLNSKIHYRLTQGLFITNSGRFEDEQQLTEAFFDIRITTDLMALLNSASCEVKLDADMLRALMEAVKTAELLSDAGKDNFTLNARALVQISEALALLLNHGDVNSQFVLDALRAEFIRMSVLLHSRVSAHLSDNPALDALRAPMNQFFAGLLNIGSSGPTSDLSWAVSGHLEMEKLRLAAVIASKKALKCPTQPVEYETIDVLTNIGSALETFKPIFYR